MSDSHGSLTGCGHQFPTVLPEPTKKTSLKSNRMKSLKHTRKAACRISAAALMLGVSHGATIGFNFAANYCGASSYSGAYVTGTAFGIATNGWESLSQMDTGYGCTSGVGPYTLNEVIDTAPAAGGLNPLPNGSLNVTWSAYESNVSGFGGYEAPPPHYTFGGNGYSPGNEQVYWGFLRDGVNFGSGSSGGNNNQEGWSVDITGLKSVFTNSSFVVETIGAGDSIQNLTNVFIIDATLSTTQSVTYPNIPPVANVGDTAWVRGIGGGLSTGSGAVNTDHLKIIGNRAQHSAGPPAFNNASEVAGFILTDKPVITMSPQQPGVVSPGDQVTLRAIAIGVPPLSLQWQNNGVAIPGATNSLYVISNVVAGAGSYELVATNIYGSAISEAAAVTLDHLNIVPGAGYTSDTKPAGTPHDGEVLGAAILASSTDGLGVTRTGVAQFAATDPDQIVVSTATTTDFDSTSGTIMFWMRSAGPVNSGGSSAVLFNRGISSGGLSTSGVVVAQSVSGPIEFEASGGGFNYNPLLGSANVSDDNWHHVAVVNDNAVGVSIYVDGVLDIQEETPGAWAWTAGQPIDLGLSSDSYWQAYNGDLNDVRFYNQALTGTEIASVYSTGALVNTNALKMQLSFGSTNLNPGLMISWENTNSILQSASVLTGPWTDVLSGVSPYNAEIQAGQMFFRYAHTPKVIVANPYDM